MTELKQTRGYKMRPADIKADPSKRGRKFPPTFSEVLRLAESMREHGQLQPVVCHRITDGVEMVAGFTRREAGIIIAEGYPGDPDATPPILPIPPTDPDFMLDIKLVSTEEASQLFLATIAENNERTDVSDVDHAYNQQVLRLQYGMSETEIANRYGWEVSKVSRFKKLPKLTELVQLAVHKGEMGANTAYLIADLSEDEQIEAYNLGLRKGEDVKEWLRKHSAPVPPTESGALKVPPPTPTAEGTPPTPTAEGTPPTPAAPPAVPHGTPPEPLPFTPPIQPPAVPVPATQRVIKRNFVQLCECISLYSTDKTHPVIAAVSAAFLAYAGGLKTANEVEDIIRQLEKGSGFPLEG